jgi:hypothetical protein
MKKDLVAVVIPIYKEELSEFEQISLAQCSKILNNYPTFFVKSASLSANYVLKHYPKPNFEVFDDRYFGSTKAYNQLMINPDFYERFSQFEYILIYQLDAFVFKNELQDWCKKGFDYVGAPDLKDIDLSKNTCKPVMLNGGLSLRKVKSFKRFLKVFHFLYPQWPANEDALFSVYFPRSYPLRPLLKLPRWQQALSFGFEQQLTDSLKLNNGQLPFGCHAWEKYDIGFWRPIFEQHGYKI